MIHFQDQIMVQCVFQNIDVGEYLYYVIFDSDEEKIFM